jgi:dienelactone hydrolase
VLVLAAVVLLLRIGDQDRHGPAHEQLSIGDGIPATLYLPVDAPDDGDFPDPPPKGHRPPVIVMAHGYSADRASMSGLARSLARAGYAVLSIDLRGHGANTHAFEGDLRDDFRAAVDYIVGSPYVDGSRLAVMGHSMGAGAALDFATVDSRPKAVIPLSGGWEANDAVVPANVLMIRGSSDPGQLKDHQDVLVKTLRAAGAKVTPHTVSGANHLTVLHDDDTVRSIVRFLDPVLGLHHDRAPGFDDPRYATSLLYLAVVFALLASLGLAVGQAVPSPAGAAGDPRRGPSWLAFALPAGALVLTAPLLTVGGFDLLPLGAGQPIVMHLVLASAVLWGGRALAQRGQLGGRTGALLAEGTWMPLRAAVVPGLVSGGVIVALLLPLAPILHRMVPTPSRALCWVVLAVAAVPFFAAFESLVRRGRGATATLAGIGGKVLLLVVLGVGVALGLLPFVISLVFPVILLQYVMLEIFAGTAFARGRNPAVIAVTEAVLVAYLVVTLSPIS